MTRSQLALLSLGVTQLFLVDLASAKPPTIAHWVHGKENKETVVLIHGFISSHATWNTLVGELSKKYRVLVYDQPGHGLSPADGEDYSPRQMARRLKHLLDHLNIEKSHVVGHSMGGRTAMKFAALYPEMVTSLVIEDMNFLSDPQLKKQLPEIRAKYPKVREAIPNTFPSQETAVKALSAFYSRQEIYFILASAKLGQDGSVQLGNRPEVTNLYLAEGLALDMTEELESIAAPMAFFAADPQNETAVLKGEGLEHVRSTRPDALVRVFSGSDHTIHDRADYAEALSSFLSR